MNWESSIETYIIVCKIDSQWEFAVGHRELNLVLCDNLEGWEASSRGRGHRYTYDWYMLIYQRNQHNMLKQLSSNSNKFKKRSMPCGYWNNWIMGSLSLLQGIFPTQGSNPGLPHCRQILYQLNHKGSPRILEWVAYPFSRGSSQPRNQTGVSYMAGGFFNN